MDLSSLGLGTSAEVAAIVAVVGVIVQLLKKQTNLNVKYLPWIAAGLGAIAGVAVFAYFGDASYLNGALLGLLSGGATSGLFDGLQPAVTAAVSAVTAKKTAKETAAKEQAAQEAAAETEKLNAAVKSAVTAAMSTQISVAATLESEKATKAD